MKYKKRTVHFLFIGGLLIISCQRNSSNLNEHQIGTDKKTESIYDPNNYLSKGTFHKEEGILWREREKYDIKPAVGINNKIKFSFYNYGEELQINKMCIEDVFSSQLSLGISLFIIEDNEISNFVQRESQTYGIWGKIDITNIDPIFMIHNVFVSPLATKFIMDHSYTDDGTLVLVHFESKNRYKNYLFLGNYITKDIIENYYSFIETQSEMSHGIDDRWENN